MKLLLLYFLVPAILIPVIFLSQRQSEVEYVNGEDIKMWVTTNGDTEYIMEKQWNALSMILFSIWLIGFCIIFVRKIIRDTKIIKQLKILATLEKASKMNEIKDGIRKELKIQKNIEIYKTRLVDSPCLCGILKPKIFFPEISFSEEEIEFLLKHELYHYKRNDVFYNMIISLFLGIHWFNPVVRIFITYLYNFTEISCDQYVLKNYQTEEREQYAHLLIHLSGERPERKIYGLTSFKSQSQKFINRRLYNIMKQKRYAKKLVVTGVICSMLLCPTITYASTVAVTKAYNGILKYVPYNESLGFYKMSEKNMPKDLPKQKIIRTEGTYFTIDPKVTNTIDFKIAPNGKKETSAYVKKGQNISINLISEKESDKFKAVISLNSIEKKVVHSNNGVIRINDYQADASGTYEILIQNITTSETIHVSGTISIAND